MKPSQRPGAKLTGVETCLGWLLPRCQPVKPIELSLHEAYGRIAAEMPAPAQPVPLRNIAVIDGFAFQAGDIAGASSYSPVFLQTEPVWVEVGQSLPDGCDCVIDAGLVESNGSVVQVIGEAVPGEGVRRTGEDAATDLPVIAVGTQLGSLDLMRAQRVGMTYVAARVPRVRIVNVPDAQGETATSRMIANLAGAAGANVALVDAKGRDADAVAVALGGSCDLVVVIGGSGAGTSDAAVEALSQSGEVFAHGIALKPGRTAALGSVTTTPVVALPGMPDQALAAWWTLALPVLDHLSGRVARATITRPLARKIASGIGVTEIVLLQNHDDSWLPLATGDLTLGQLGAADAWLAVPQDSEGYAPGTPAAAYGLRETS